MPKKKQIDADNIEKQPKAPRIVSPEELMPDGTLLCEFVIPGRPATKKNHGRIIHSRGTHILLPSEQFTKYEEHCKEYVLNIWKNKNMQPIDFGISVHMKIYLPSWVIGDQTNYQQSIADILQQWGFVKDDKFIHFTDEGEHWLGGIDKENPRVELTVRRFRHPYEDYRAEQERKELIKIQKKIQKQNKV